MARQLMGSDWHRGSDFGVYGADFCQVFFHGFDARLHYPVTKSGQQTFMHRESFYLAKKVAVGVRIEEQPVYVVLNCFHHASVL